MPAGVYNKPVYRFAKTYKSREKGEQQMARSGHFLNKRQPEAGENGWISWISALLGMATSAAILSWMLMNIGTMGNPAPNRYRLADKFDRYVDIQLSAARGSEIPEKPVYYLSDSDIAAPKPDPKGFGQIDDPKDLEKLLSEAREQMAGQETFLQPDTPRKEDSTVRYYRDETIFVLTWKQVVDNGVYTFSEIKIAHPSQFRRFLSENEYGSGVLHTTSEMSQSVNAVVASSGDYYGYRSIGIVVNGGVVYRDRGHFLDTCYIDENGDLLFTFAGDITKRDAAERFVEENHVRFSLSFGPVMILNGEYRVPATYNSGEIDKGYSRAALCQLGELHYLLVAANAEPPYGYTPTVKRFGQRLFEMGIPTAYALDGGQTATIVMNHELINHVSYSSQRDISDIIYFATALPEDGTD